MGSSQNRSNVVGDDAKPTILQQDKDALAALTQMEDYAPPNKDFTLAKVQAASEGMDSAQEIETQKFAAPPPLRAMTRPRRNGPFTTPFWAPRTRWWRSTARIPTKMQAMGLTKKSEISRARSQGRADAPTRQGVRQTIRIAPYYVRSARDVLLGLYKGYEHKLGDWGFDVVAGRAVIAGKSHVRDQWCASAFRIGSENAGFF